MPHWRLFSCLSSFASAKRFKEHASMSEQDDSKVPQWLQAELFESLLSKQVENFKSIAKFKAQPALAAGENYATIMLRINIEVNLQDGSKQSQSFMLKILPQSELFLRFLKHYNDFNIETEMYEHIVPELCELYKQVGVVMKFGACYYKLNTEQHNIVLEDLKPQGFQTVNRLQGLDMRHTKAVLIKIAQWHAASAHRVATKGHYSEIYQTGYIKEESRDLLEQTQSNSLKMLLKCALTYKNNELYISELQKCLPELLQQLIAYCKRNDSAFNVLNHGDLWCNNILFQYNKHGEISETYLVDYQIPKYGSPSQDLYYFLLSSTQLDIKVKHFDELIKFYYDQLIMHLRILKYPQQLPTLQEIHADLYKNGIWALYTACRVMAVVLVDPTETANLDNFLSNSEEANDFKKQMYSNARYRSHMEEILPWLYNRGAMSF